MTFVTMERAFAWLDSNPPDVSRSQIRSFEWVFVAVVACEYWIRALPKWDLLSWHYIAATIAVTCLALPALSVRGRRAAFAAIGIIQAIIFWREFPASSNHSFLEVFICFLAASMDVEDEGDRRLYANAVRWMVCVILFYSGVQKLVHGYWDHGEFLSYSAQRQSYERVLGFLLPQAELARVIEYGKEPGAGSFRTQSTAFLWVSNFVWLAEIVLAPLLVFARTRVIAVIAAILLMVAIECGALELMFGVMFVNCICMFAPAKWHRFAAGFLVLFVLALLVLRLLRPEIMFT